MSKHWLLGGWYTSGVIIIKQKYQPIDSNNTDVFNIGTLYHCKSTVIEKLNRICYSGAPANRHKMSTLHTFANYTVKPVIKDTSIYQIPFSPLMNSAYNCNLYMKWKQLIYATFSCLVPWRRIYIQIWL